MKKVLSILMAVAILATSFVIPAFAETTPTIRDINDYLTIHYDFEGDDLNSQFADKATSGSSDDKLAFDGEKATALEYYSVADGAITSTDSCDIVPVATANKADLLESNVGIGTWFIRCKATAATPLIDFRHMQQQSTQNRCFYLALDENGNIVIEGKSGADGATHKSTTMTYYEYDYASAPWLNLAVVRKIVDGTYYFYFYISTGNSPLQLLTTNGTWPARVSFGATEASGLTSAENINLGLFNQSYTTWKTTAGVSIDDVRYYNTELTAAELATIVSDGSFVIDEKRNIDDYMTIHYDFEETGDGVLTDKASGGTADYLRSSSYGSLDAYVFENGAVTLTTTGPNHFYTAISADTIGAGTGEGTWFLRFKSSPIEADMPILDFRANGNSRPLFVYLDYETSQICFATAAGGTASNTAITKTGPKYDFETSPWMNVALVRHIVCESGINYYYYSMYVSIGEAVPQYVGGLKVATEKVGVASAEQVYLALFNQAGMRWTTNPGLSIDDVRYYDTELMVAEIATILPAATVAQEHTEFIGYQVSDIYEKDGENCYKLRLVGEIDSRDYTEAGMRLTVTVGEKSYTTDNPIATVFTSLLTDFGKGTYIASEGKYLFAVVITDIPENMLPTVAVTTYAKTADACYFCGNPVTFSVTSADFAVAD